MKRYLLLLTMLTASLAAGCFYTRGSYPPVENKQDPLATWPDETATPPAREYQPNRTATTGPAPGAEEIPPTEAAPPGTETTTTTNELVEDTPAPAEGGSRVKITRTETTRTTRTVPAPDDERVSRLYGTAVKAEHVVYVIDRSAATNKYWEDVRLDVIASIGDLHASQDFALVLMGAARPTVGPEKALAAGVKRNQALAAKLLLATEAGGQTDPLSALRTAISILSTANAAGGKVIYFVTDRPMTDAAIVRMLQAPAAKNIVVMTYMLGEGGQDTRTTLEKMAAQTGGRFTHVTFTSSRK